MAGTGLDLELWLTRCRRTQDVMRAAGQGARGAAPPPARPGELAVRGHVAFLRLGRKSRAMHPLVGQPPSRPAWVAQRCMRSSRRSTTGTLTAPGSSLRHARAEPIWCRRLARRKPVRAWSDAPHSHTRFTHTRAASWPSATMCRGNAAARHTQTQPHDTARWCAHTQPPHTV